MVEAILPIWLATVVALFSLGTAAAVIPAEASGEGARAFQQQTTTPYQVANQDVVNTLSSWFAGFQQFEFASRGWVNVGDLNTASTRLNQWDVEVYVDPGHLQATGANAAYEDCTGFACLGYFNDLVLPADPATMVAQGQAATLWHEVMHAIFDASEPKQVATDEAYTWYMEGLIQGLPHLMAFEQELSKGPNCSPQQLQNHWQRFSTFMTQTAPTLGGYGALNNAQKAELSNLTGIQMPDPQALYQQYQSAGLLQQCLPTPTPTSTLTPTPSSTPVPTPTPASTPIPGKAKASLLFLMDNSGSMDDKIDSAIRGAQRALSTLPADTEVAVLFFGTSGCDVQNVQGFTLDHDLAQNVVASARASGSTPLAAAIQQGGAYMRANAHSSDQIMALMSDGEETCDGDPISAAHGLNDSGPVSQSGCAPAIAGALDLLPAQPVYAQGQPTIRLHVVGYGIDSGSAAEEQLRQIAEAGQGQYFSAEDEEELTQSLEQATKVEDSRRPLIIAGAAVLCLTALLAAGVVASRALSGRRRPRAVLPTSAAPRPATAPEALASRRPSGGPERMQEPAQSAEGSAGYCPECGTQLASGASFCSNCGARVTGRR
jgi:hypothetical protein